MGNCCGGEGVEITSAKQNAQQPPSYAVRPSNTPSYSTDGHHLPNTGLASSSPPPTATPVVRPDYAPNSFFPSDPTGVYYQPSGHAVLMGLPLTENAGHAQAATPTQPTTPTVPMTPGTTIITTATTVAPEVHAAAPEVVVSSVTSSAAPERQQSVNYQPRDVMISYSRSDTEIMLQIKDALEAQDMTVWIDQSSLDAGADFLSKIGEAIIDAKFFICILSEKAVNSKYCRDEVALAYVSNTAIYPVNIQPRDRLLPLMDTGLKLQLANYNWTSLTDADARADNLQTLVSSMKAELDDLGQQAEEGGPFSSPFSSVTSTSAEEGREDVTSPTDVVVGVQTVGVKEGGSPVQSPVSDGEPPDFKAVRKLRERNRAIMTLQPDDVSHITHEQFWSDQFGVADYVMWDRFTGAFLEVFKEPVEATFTSEDQQQLLDILRRELEVDSDDRIYKYQLIAFCSIYGDMSALWPRVHEQARESFAMREVFNMDSSVRVEAIENLGKFRSAAVIDALRDLLTDPDANVRAVATVSLSRTNANDPVTIRHILRTLSDKDRLVREAGCLALGHLKARQAISKLSHLWRNDVISHVREAAAVALRQIGGQEVEDVMRVTKVLAEEIRSLTETNS